MIPNNVIPAFPKFEMRNPTEYTNKLIEEQNEKISGMQNKIEESNLELQTQTKELQALHYENMKLNAQIEVLNKTIDKSTTNFT